MYGRCAGMVRGGIDDRSAGGRLLHYVPIFRSGVGLDAGVSEFEQ